MTQVFRSMTPKFRIGDIVRDSRPFARFTPGNLEMEVINVKSGKHKASWGAGYTINIYVCQPTNGDSQKDIEEKHLKKLRMVC